MKVNESQNTDEIKILLKARKTKQKNIMNNKLKTKKIEKYRLKPEKNLNYEVQ